jgi:peptidoglycan hydrolase CwlO-like protein
MQTIFIIAGYAAIAIQLLFIHLQNRKIMSSAEDLQALVARLTTSQASLKTSLDSVKAGVATIVAGLPATGGLTADEVAALKLSLSAAADTEDANAAEGAEDAAVVAAAQPAAPAPEPAA